MQSPGWYEDPEDPRRLRWWTGNQWSNRWMDREGAPSAESPVAPQRTASPPPFPPAAASYGVTTGAAPSPVTSGGPWPAPPRTFTEAIKACFQKYAVFQGRASRSEYWYFALFNFLVGIAQALVFETIYVTTVSETVFGLSAIADLGLALALILPSLAVAIRRLHDIGKSGWNSLWGLIPIAGWIALFVWAVHPGEPRANAYG